jgi:hypothetical protein
MKTRDNIYTVGNFSKEYLVKNKGTGLTEIKVNYVLKTFYDLIVDEILLNNYQYKLGGCFTVQMERYTRNFSKLAVNWGASNKLKKEILARGGKPAKKVGLTPKGNPAYDDGEQWMVFYIDEFYCSLSFKYKTLKDIHEKKPFVYANFGSTFWKPIQNDKLLKRFHNYETLKKLNQNNIPLGNGIKHCIF